MLVLSLIDVIEAVNVAPICQALLAARVGDQITISMPHNKGGQIAATIDLVAAITQSKAKVTIEFDRYVISAAAFLWLWFRLRPLEHVEVRTSGNPALLVYHRPRLPTPAGTHYLFRDDLADGHPLREMLLHNIQVFDDLFEELLTALGWSDDCDKCENLEGADFWHELCHLKRAYYSNRDCVIPA